MSQLKVLVADDSHTIRTVVKRTLAKAGYEVETVANGRDAVERIAATQPHLLVLDIQMPLVDGYGVCDKLRVMGEPWDRLPVIFLTNVKSNALNLLGEKMGAYLPKPVCEQQLLETVSQLLARNAPQCDPEQAAVVD